MEQAAQEKASSPATGLALAEGPGTGAVAAVEGAGAGEDILADKPAFEPEGSDAPVRSFRDAVAEGQVGLGVDIVEIARMERILARTPSFASKVFSEEEQKYCFGKTVPAAHFATRFAAKEAVLKALGTGFSEGIGPRDIEVARTAKGRPYVVLGGRAQEIADSYGVIELPLSLSYTHAEAVACAMAITAESVRATEERVDPMEELAKQFKEARALLDEMDAREGVDAESSDSGDGLGRTQAGGEAR